MSAARRTFDAVGERWFADGEETKQTKCGNGSGAEVEVEAIKQGCERVTAPRGKQSSGGCEAVTPQVKR